MNDEARMSNEEDILVLVFQTHTNSHPERSRGIPVSYLKDSAAGSPDSRSG